MKITLNLVKPNIYLNRSQKKKRADLSSNNGDKFLYHTPIFTSKERTVNYIKKIKNLRCPVCGLIMLDKDQQTQFVSDISGKKGENLISTFEKYEDETVFLDNPQNSKHRSIFRPNKQQIVNILKDLARKNPNLSIAQLVKLKAEESLESLIKKQMAIVGELENYLDGVELDEIEKSNINSVIEEYVKQIKGESSTPFKRKSFVHALSDVTKDPEIQQNITNIISKLPTSDSEIDSFFVKYSKEGITSKIIAQKLIALSTPTIEHLMPKSKGGKNDISNYICDCDECNAKRGNMPFDEWQKTIPNFADNLQEYINTVSDIIDDGGLSPAYENYPQDVIETISRLSNGAITLVIPEGDYDEEYRALMKKRFQEITNIRNTRMRKLYIAKERLKTEIKELESHKDFSKIVQYQILLTNIDLLNKQAQEINSQMEEAKDMAQIDSLNSNLSTIKQSILRLRSTKTVLSSQFKSGEELDRTIKNYQNKLNKIDEIERKIDYLKDECANEDELREQKTILEDKIKPLIEENDSISNSGIILDSECDDYKNYLHYLELEKKADEMIRFHIRKENDYETEVTNIALIEIQKRIKELYDMPHVRYFVNKKQAEDITSEINFINEKLEEINQNKKQIEEYENEIKQLLEDKTIEQLRLELENAIKDRDVYIKIVNIQELRAQFAMVQDTISYNEAILSKLKAYRKMSSEEFRELINTIY